MKRLLLIDDENGIRVAWKTFHDITDRTYRGQCGLDTADTLREGEDMLAAEKYDAIILDLKLPPLTEEEVIQWIAKEHATLPVIMVFTGYEDPSLRDRCLAAGASGFFTKHDALSFPNLFFKEIYNEWFKRKSRNSPV